MRRFVAAFSALVLGLGLPTQAQNAPGSLAGLVSDTAGQPVQHAEVMVVGTNLIARTSADGSYSFSALPAGLYTVQARRVGFVQAVRDTVQVMSGVSTRVDFRLRQPTGGDIDVIIVPAGFNPVCSTDTAAAEGYRVHLERIYREQYTKAEVTWSRSADLCRTAVLMMTGDSTRVANDTPFVYTLKGVSGISYAILTNSAVRKRTSEWAGVCFFDSQWKRKGVCLAM
jgi:hypothetical protein